MPTVMPSQAIIALDKIYPHAARNQNGALLPPNESTKLRTLLELVNDIPDRLIVLSADDYADFVHAKATISETLLTWLHRGATGGMPFIDSKDPVTVLRRVLTLCRDEFPPAGHASLSFIKDSDIREDVRLDVGAAERSLLNGEWKAAGILAGAVTEALLHWRLSSVPLATREASTCAPTRRGAPTSYDEWVLNDLILVAEDLRVLKNKKTVTAALLTKDYRNLIHPGRAARLKEPPTRSAAHSAIGGMLAIIEELSA